MITSINEAIQRVFKLAYGTILRHDENKVKSVDILEEHSEYYVFSFETDHGRTGKAAVIKATGDVGSYPFPK